MSKQRLTIESTGIPATATTDRYRLPMRQTKSDKAETYPPPILPAGTEIIDAYPLSVLQAGMVFHSELNKDYSVYHDIYSLRVKFTFNHAAFQKALHIVIDRHPLLRTAFDLATFEEPLQLVYSKVSVPLQVDDLRSQSKEEQLQRLLAWSKQEKNQRFYWNHPPLFRVQLHRLTDESFQFWFSFHHAILDGWSLHSLVTELFTTYFNLLNAIAMITYPPALSYKDFVALERDTINSLEAKHFWSQHLADSRFIPAPLTEPQKLKENTHDVGVLLSDIPTDLLEKLQQLAKQLNVSLKSITLAAHLYILSYLSGERDITTGIVANGRLQEADGDKTYGLFVNIIPFRQKLLSGTWVDFIKQVFHHELSILPHRRFPLLEIQKLNQGKALFETVFDFRQFHIYNHLTKLPGFTFSIADYYEHTNFPLMVGFIFTHNNSHLKLQLRYHTSKYDKNRITKLQQYYKWVLRTIANAPSSLCHTISLFTREERKAWHRLNHTATPSVDSMGIHHLFEAQAQATPQAIALVYGHKKMTYQTLDECANQAANRLRKSGVAPGSLVGICLTKGMNTWVALLGILKAGCAYVPLDPTYPSERLQFILKDTQLQCVITEQSADAALSMFHGKRLYLSEIINSLSTEKKDYIETIQLIPAYKDDATYSTHSASIGEENTPHETFIPHPHQLAYVIYTSGSVGQPKGVQVTHQSVVNLLIDMRKKIKISADDIMPSLASIAFDMSIPELFLPLIAGATIAIIPPSILNDGIRLQHQLDAHRITLMQAVPAMWRLLLDSGWQGKSLKTILCGAEPFPNELLEQLKSLNVSLWNLYGPTETTVWSTFHHITPDNTFAPLGKPIANTQIYILNHALQQVPYGVAGELHIGGMGISRGYLNHPDLTAEKYIPNPFSNLAGSRLYKTGDIVKMDENTHIHYLGRTDHQVKVRGYRIELAEIENCLSSHEHVKQSLVITENHDTLGTLLIAYIVLKDNATPCSASDFITFLSDKLPSFMTPSSFIFLKQFPLSFNGKIDRRALPSYKDIQATETRNLIAPQTETEKKLQEIWEDTLQIKPISVTDNFFALGGHSILALRIILRIRELFNEELPVSILFKANTIRLLAKLLETPQRTEDITVPLLVPLNTTGDKSPLFLIHPMGGHTYCYLALAKYFKDKRPVYALKAREQHPITSIEAMASEYIQQIKSIQPKGPYLLGGWCMGAIVAYEMAQQLSQAKEEVGLLAIISANATELIPKTLVNDETALMIEVFGGRLTFSREKMDSLSTIEEKLAHVIDTVRQADKLRKDITGINQAKALLSLYKTNAAALDHYRMRPYPGNILLFKAENEHFQDTPLGDLGWTPYAGKQLSIRQIKGTHLTILQEPWVKALANEIEIHIP